MEVFDAVAVLGGTLFGFVLGRREWNLSRRIGHQTGTRCECRHLYSMHSSYKGCQECECLQYVGDTPPAIQYRDLME